MTTAGGRQTAKPKFNEFNISKTAEGPAPSKWAITSMDAGAQKTKQKTKGSQKIATQGGQAAGDRAGKPTGAGKATGKKMEQIQGGQISAVEDVDREGSDGIFMDRCFASTTIRTRQSANQRANQQQAT